SSRRRHTISKRDWSSDVCSSDLSLANYHAQQAQLIKLDDQARESKRAADIARLRYREGVIDFLQLLDAEGTQLQAEDSVAQSEQIGRASCRERVETSELSVAL